jgi:hypothetical protein
MTRAPKRFAISGSGQAPLPSGAAWSRAALLLVVALYAAARLWRLTDSCLWFDEIFSVHAARHEWGAMLRFVAADIIHPPLFYALLKVWVSAGGESLLWLRLLPALLSVLCVAPLLLLCRELRLTAFETNAALVLAGASGYLIKYAQEVRMYSLLLLLTLFSLWLFARSLRAAGGRGETRALAAIFVVNLLLVYTHYYGWLVVAAQLFFLLVRSRRSLPRFLVMTALLAVCFAPWVYALAAARGEQGRGLEQNIGWVERPALADAARFVALAHEPFYYRQSSGEPAYMRWGDAAAALVFLLPFCLLALRVLRRREGEVGTNVEGGGAKETPAGDDRPAARGEGALFVWLLVFSFVPVALAFAASRALPQSVWGTRHLIVSAAPLLILSAVALARVRPAWTRAALLTVMSCWFVWGAFVARSRGGGPYVWCAWEKLAAEAAEAEVAPREKVSVYAFEELVAYHLWYALGDDYEVSVVKGVGGIAEDPAYFLPRAFDAVRRTDLQDVTAGERFLIAFRAGAWDERRQPLRALRERGYVFEEVREFGAQGQRAFLVTVRR